MPMGGCTGKQAVCQSGGTDATGRQAAAAPPHRCAARAARAARPAPRAPAAAAWPTAPHRRPGPHRTANPAQKAMHNSKGIVLQGRLCCAHADAWPGWHAHCAIRRPPCRPPAGRRWRCRRHAQPPAQHSPALSRKKPDSVAVRLPMQGRQRKLHYIVLGSAGWALAGGPAPLPERPAPCRVCCTWI